MEIFILIDPDFTRRIQLIFWAVFSLLLGVGFIFCGFVVFGYLVAALPWALSAAGLLLWFRSILPRRRRKNYAGTVLGAVVFCCGIVLFRWAYLRDAFLWYIFVAYLIISAYVNMRPAWNRGVEKYVLARYIGGLTVWGFSALLLFMPRSGLSDALQILGVFSAAWGIYQLLLPPVREWN